MLAVLSVRFSCFFGQSETPTFPLKKNGNHKNTGAALRNDGGKTRARNAHVKHENKYRVEHYVYHRPEQHRAHGGQRIALGQYKGIEPLGQHCEKRTAGIYPEIGNGKIRRALRAAEQLDNGPRKGECNSSENGADEKKQRKEVLNTPFAKSEFPSPILCLLGAPPSPTRLAKACIISVMGSTIPRAARASIPDCSILATYILSTMLYKRLSAGQ